MQIPRVNNFGLLRYIMAFSILAGHFNFLVGTELPVPVSAYDCVGGFFVLSGFLVYNSYRNSTGLKDYAIRRARRLLPPYILIVLLCAFGLSAVSTLPAADYFASADLWKYIAANLAFLNFLQPDLPGVFADSPTAAVNASLWTLKEEWMLYFLFPAVMCLISRYRLNRFGSLAAVYLLSVAYRAALLYAGEATGSQMCIVMSRQVFGCVSFFFTGIALYVYYEQFRRHRWAFLAIAFAMLPLSYAYSWAQLLLRPAAIGILLIFFGTTGSWGHWAASRNNISYDVYLFHFPVIQLAVALRLTHILPPAATLVLTALTVAALSSLSWFLLDRPLLHPRHT